LTAVVRPQHSAVDVTSQEIALDHAVAQFVKARLPDWHSLLQTLVRHRSVFEHEHEIVEYVAGHLERLGIDVMRVSHEPHRLSTLSAAQQPISAVSGRDSLVARLPGRGVGRSLVLNTHLDVVPEGDPSTWSHPPFAGIIEDGRVYGRGAMDDKAGVTIALALAELIVTLPLPLQGDVLFQFVLDDEITGNGSLLCLEAGYRGDAAIIIDGTRPDRAIDRHAGQLQFDVHVTGRPASVSVSHLGLNAAELLAQLVIRLRDAFAALNASRIDPWTRFPSPFQLITQRLDAAGPPLTVPDRAAATCYTTFPPPWTLATAQAFLRDEVSAFSHEHRLAVTPELVWNGFSAEPTKADARELGEALMTAATLGPIDIGPSTGTSDLRHFVAARIPCLLYGPGSGFNPHRANEYYELDDLPRMVELFSSLVRRWCGVSATAGH
jgi:acetylornithine deacetylase